MKAATACYSQHRLNGVISTLLAGTVARQQPNLGNQRSIIDHFTYLSRRKIDTEASLRRR